MMHKSRFYDQMYKQDSREENVYIGRFSILQNEKCPDENIWARGMAHKSRALTKTSN